MCMGVLPACVSVHYVHLLPEESRRGHWTLGLEGPLEERPVLLTTGRLCSPVTMFLMERGSRVPKDLKRKKSESKKLNCFLQSVPNLTDSVMIALLFVLYYA